MRGSAANDQDFAVTEAEEGTGHRLAGIPNWISAGAAVVAAIGGIAFGIASLGSSDSASPPPTTAPPTSANGPDNGGPTVSPPRIITVRQNPPPIVAATGTAEHLPADARVYIGVRTVPLSASSDTGSAAASGSPTSAWELSTRGASIDKDGTWAVSDFEIPGSVQEPYEFFAVATSRGHAPAVSNVLGSTSRSCLGPIEPITGPNLAIRCEVAKSSTVRYSSP